MPAKKKNKCGFDGATLARCKQTVGQGPASKRRPGGVLKHCSASGGGLRTCPKEGMGGPTDRLLRLYGGHSVNYLNNYLNTLKEGLSKQGRSKLDKLKLIQKHKGIRGLPKNSMY